MWLWSHGIDELWYGGTFLIWHTKGREKCVGLYRMSEYSGFILVNKNILGPYIFVGCHRKTLVSDCTSSTEYTIVDLYYKNGFLIEGEAMWDAMRSPFQAKHINDSMFIESRYWQFLVLFLLLLLKISFVISKVLYFILQVTVKYNFTIHCNMWNLQLLKTFHHKSVNHLRSPPIVHTGNLTWQ